MSWQEEALGRPCPKCGQPAGKPCKRTHRISSQVRYGRRVPGARKGSIMRGHFHHDRLRLLPVDPLAIDMPKLAAWLREHGHILTEGP